MAEAGSEIDITVFTDPLCCWSWAFEPQLQEIKRQLGQRAAWQYRMCGLIPSWDNFYDEVNAVTRPAQMGPVWMLAGQIANLPVNHHLWIKDPPASSYPACMAVKCAQLQSPQLGELLLASLREACMKEGRNIARKTVLFDVAMKLATAQPLFNFELFVSNYQQDKGYASFRADLDLVRYYQLNRFPTLIIKPYNQKATMLSGYRHSIDVMKAIECVVPVAANRQPT